MYILTTKHVFLLVAIKMFYGGKLGFVKPSTSLSLQYTCQMSSLSYVGRAKEGRKELSLDESAERKNRRNAAAAQWRERYAFWLS